jgi:hypothetical protein
MFRRRVSIAGLMWAVFLLAVGLAALKSSSDAWSGSIFLLTCGTLAVGVVGIACDVPAARRWWVGFTVFGLGYLALAFCVRLERLDLPPLATDQLIEWLGGVFESKARGGLFSEYYMSVFWPFARIGHCLLALVIGTAAGLIAWWIFPAPSSKVLHPADPVAEQASAAPRRWIWAIGIGLVILYAAAAVVGMRTAPVLWAGATFLLTWAWIGAMALGAVFGRGQRRARRLGAVLFGAGYMVLISWHSGEESWAEIPGNRLFGAVRQYLPRVPTERRAASDGIAGANALLLKALDKPIVFRFAKEVPLQDALDYLSTTVRTDDGRPLPIYVNPNALQEVDKTLQSPVTLVLEGVPLRTGLDCLLRQVSMAYEIKGGLIEVVSEIDRLEHHGYLEPAYEDPLLLTGHCLLALAAAGLGGLFAPLVCDRRLKQAR